MCVAALIFITGQPFFNLTGVCPFHNSTAISTAQIPAGRTYNTAIGINIFPIEKVCNATIAKNVCPTAAITAILPQIFNVFFALKIAVCTDETGKFCSISPRFLFLLLPLYDVNIWL